MKTNCHSSRHVRVDRLQQIKSVNLVQTNKQTTNYLLLTLGAAKAWGCWISFRDSPFNPHCNLLWMWVSSKCMRTISVKKYMWRHLSKFTVTARPVLKKVMHHLLNWHWLNIYKYTNRGINKPNDLKLKCNRNLWVIQICIFQKNNK